MDYKCIWVKYGGWPLWPCRLANGCEVGPKLASGKESEDQVLVKFFGTPDEYAWVESKNIKNFSLKSINELNPLFRSVSERKLYETAIKEVIEWHKTKDEDRIIPVWKPGDEDTQGTHSLSNSEDSDDDGGGNNDWDYIDVGSSSIIDDDVAESTLESYDTPPKETSKSSKKQKSPPRTEHIKREKSSGGEQKRGVQYKALQINRQYEKSTNSKQNDTTDNTLASGKDPPNKILASTDKKRQLDLVGAGVSNSPKKTQTKFYQ